MKIKYLLLGNRGQLGQEFEKLLTMNNAEFRAYDLPELNINSSLDLFRLFMYYRPNVVINCAAFTNVDAAEVNYHEASMINHHGVESIAKLCNVYNAKLIHFSTDYVFDGKKSTPYIETDATIPLNYYGISKLNGEIAIDRVWDKYIIYRLSWVYGNGNQNFISNMLNWSKNNRTLRIVDDEISIPCSAKLIAETVLNSLDNNLNGIYHLTNSGQASRYEYALEVAKLMKLEVEILPSKMQDFPSDVKRPGYSVLSNQKFINETQINLPDWQESLAEFFSNMKLSK